MRHHDIARITHVEVIGAHDEAQHRIDVEHRPANFDRVTGPELPRDDRCDTVTRDAEVGRPGNHQQHRAEKGREYNNKRDEDDPHCELPTGRPLPQRPGNLLGGVLRGSHVQAGNPRRRRMDSNLPNQSGLS